MMYKSCSPLTAIFVLSDSVFRDFTFAINSWLECPRFKFKFVDCHTEYDNSSFTTFWFKDIDVLY